MQLTETHKTDLLEIGIVFFILLLIIVIYVPVAIWEEETHYQRESRFRTVSYTHLTLPTNREV